LHDIADGLGGDQAKQSEAKKLTHAAMPGVADE